VLVRLKQDEIAAGYISNYTLVILVKEYRVANLRVHLKGAYLV